MKKVLESEIFEPNDVKKDELNKEKRRNIIVGAILRSIHKQQGTMPYLLQVIEPYLKKGDRKLFGLPF